MNASESLYIIICNECYMNEDEIQRVPEKKNNEHKIMIRRHKIQTVNLNHKGKIHAENNTKYRFRIQIHTVCMYVHFSVTFHECTFYII